MGYNPCYCWNLKDGCITIGIWTLVHSLMQLGLFAWQSYILHGCRYLLMIEYSFNNCQDWCPCAGNNDIGDTHTLVEGIFIIQIIILIASFFLLFASMALIYGIHTNSKHLVWPWFPCITISIITSLIYCILWWAGNVESYWLVLTIIEFLSVLVNVYCLLCIIVQYRRILKGYVQQDDTDEYSKHRKIVYEYRPKQEIDQSKIAIVDSYQEKKAKSNEFLEKQQPHDMMPTLSELQQMYAASKGASPLEKKKAPPGGGGGGPAAATATVGSGSPGFKAKFTEAWLNGVNNHYPKEEGRECEKYAADDHQQQQDRSPERLYGRAKSLGDLQEKPRAKMKSSKSKESVSSRSHNHHHHHRRCSRHRHGYNSSSSTNSSSPSDKDGDESESESKFSKDHRIGGSCRHQHQHRRHNQYSDSDTGYSASSAAVSDSEQAATTSHRHNQRCRHRKKREKPENGEKPRQTRRPRDVKREDRRRLKEKYANEAATIDDSTSTASVPLPTMPCRSEKPAGRHPCPAPPSRPPPPGAVPVLPSASSYFGARPAPPPPPPGGVSIPQHIIIPPRPPSDDPQRPGRPQKYQINSEITIRYDEQQQKDGRQDAIRSPGIGQIPTSTTPSGLGQRSTPASGQPLPGQRSTPSEPGGGPQQRSATPSAGQGHHHRSSPADQVGGQRPPPVMPRRGQRSTPSTTPATTAGPSVNISPETATSSSETKKCVATAV